MTRWGTVTGCALALLLAPSWAPKAEEKAEKLGRAVDFQMKMDGAAKASQERVSALDDETTSLLSDYRRSVAEAESYTTYARQLELQVRSQDEEMAAIERQLGEVDTTAREVGPLMDRMLSTLDRFVSLDVPFLVAERRDRVERLKQMMGRADVTISEKYRRIIEAYQVELDYGRTVEAYEAELSAGEAGKAARTVQFLRVGRIALLYQTLDGQETGFWDATAKRWTVDPSYGASFKEGIAVAKKTRAPELLVIPVPAATAASTPLKESQS